LQENLFPALRRTEISVVPSDFDVNSAKASTAETVTPYTTSTYSTATKHVAATTTDGNQRCVEVRFRVSSSDLQSEPRNQQQLRQMTSAIDSIKQGADITGIRLVGYSSPDGSEALNRTLSQQRMESLRRYLVTECQLAATPVKAEAGGENWADLRDYVAASQMADKDGLLSLIDSNMDLDQKLAQIKRRYPKAYRELHDQVFPSLRRTEMCISYRKKAPTPQEPVVTPAPVVEQPTPAPTEEPVVAEPEREPKAIVALKTNLLFDAILWPNAEIERWFGKNRQWSVMAEWGSPWYVWHHNSRAYEILNVGVEGRYWLNAKSPDHRWLTGWFAGAYVMSGKYDIEWASKGYQGEYWSPGLTFGYAHRIGKWWNMEYSIGVGYLGTRWRRYYGMFEDRHLIWQFNGNSDYIGPTKLKISLVYLLNDNLFHKKQKKGGKK